MSNSPQAKPTPLNIEEKQDTASNWFRELRNQFVSAFEVLEHEAGSDARFDITPWDRPEGGSGEMGLMRGKIFEKVGVNISTVHGTFSEEFRKQIPGTEDDASFWAAGVSLVAHMANPHVPAMHMNTRFITTAGKEWFGGGGDLTPMFDDEPAKNQFHAALKTACDAHNPTYYPAFKEKCDDYFYLPHRDEPRGVGGIFYDYHDTDNWEADFAFTKDVGKALVDAYPKIIRERMEKTFTAEDREHQLHKRGRYVEFNLLHDRGTKFGLMTGGNVEAILMSMPPEVKW